MTGARWRSRSSRRCSGRVATWPLEDESFATAARGLRRIYRDGRRALRAASSTDDPETWHEWRKRVKDLWYAARILRAVAPLELGAVVDEADQLGELLGDHNDLAVLRAAVAAHPDATTDDQAERLRTAIDDAATRSAPPRHPARTPPLRGTAQAVRRARGRVLGGAHRAARRRGAVDHPPHRGTHPRAARRAIERRPARPRAHRARTAQSRLPRLRSRQARRTSPPPTSTQATSTRWSPADPCGCTEAACCGSCKMLGVRLGIADHLGWAVAVTATADHEVATAAGSGWSSPVCPRRRSTTSADASTSPPPRRWWPRFERLRRGCARQRSTTSPPCCPCPWCRCRCGSGRPTSGRHRRPAPRAV